MRTQTITYTRRPCTVNATTRGGAVFRRQREQLRRCLRTRLERVPTVEPERPRPTVVGRRAGLRPSVVPRSAFGQVDAPLERAADDVSALSATRAARRRAAAASIARLRVVVDFIAAAFAASWLTGARP